jgi:hypothetical protein
MTPTDKPRFAVGDTVRILQFITPLPRGTQVAIVNVNPSRGGFKYMVRCDYKGQPVKLTVLEKDLDLPFI